jgi:D-amino-acid dehydrogenase
VVIGGGLIGLNVGLRLQARGDRVTLIESSGQGSTAASYGNAGHIAIEQVEPLASMAMVKSAPKRLFMNGGALSLRPGAAAEWLPFSLRLLKAAQPARFAVGKAALSTLIAYAMPAWRRCDVDLGGGLLREDGHFVVWETPDSAGRGRKAWQGADTGTATFRDVTADELQRLSGLTRQPLAGGIRFENTGQVVDMRRYLDRLAARFRERGGEIVTARATRLTPQGDGFTIALDIGVTVSAAATVVCAGVWSKALLEPLGFKVPIIAERGYHVQSARHDWPDLPPVVFEDRSMIVTRFAGGLRAASFVELACPGDPPDRRKWQRLRAHIKDLGLPFGDADAADEWIGARPTLPDYLPAIGRAMPNLYYAFGHQHLGLTLAPLTGEIVADMVSSGAAPKAFDLNRFA